MSKAAAAMLSAVMGRNGSRRGLLQKGRDIERCAEEGTLQVAESLIDPEGMRQRAVSSLSSLGTRGKRSFWKGSEAPILKALSA